MNQMSEITIRGSRQHGRQKQPNHYLSLIKFEQTTQGSAASCPLVLLFRTRQGANLVGRPTQGDAQCHRQQTLYQDQNALLV